jgi:hypothetical protein
MKCKNGIIFEEQEYDTQKQAVMGVSTSADVRSHCGPPHGHVLIRTRLGYDNCISG